MYENENSEANAHVNENESKQHHDDSFWNKGKDISYVNEKNETKANVNAESELDPDVVLKGQREILIDLNEKNKMLKSSLKQIIDNLNNLIDESSSKLYSEKEKEAESTLVKKDAQSIARMEKTFELRQKELKSLKTQLGNYKAQLDNVTAKASEKLSSKRIGDMEEQLDKLKKESEDYIKKIKSQKNSQLFKSRELELFSKNKTYPAKVNSLTEEIKNLVAKKHEYNNKFNNHKRSIQNMRNYLENTEKIFTDVVNSLKSLNRFDSVSDVAVKSIEAAIVSMKGEFNTDDVDILEKMAKDELTIFKQMGSTGNRDRNSSPKGKINSSEQFGVKETYSKSPNQNSNFTQLPLIKDKFVAPEKESNEKNFSSSMNMKKHKKISILKKFEYLNSKENSSQPHYMRDLKDQKHLHRISSPDNGMAKNTKSIPQGNLISSNNSNKKIIAATKIIAPGSGGATSHKTNISKQNNTHGSNLKSNPDINQREISSEEENEELAELNFDFENTRNEDYETLIKKLKQLNRINEKIERNYKDLDKVYEKKYKEIQNQTEANKKKATILQKQNELFAIEISDLTKIIKLNMEESQLKKELKDNSEVKNDKSINISQTHNDILNELNNLLKNEETLKGVGSKNTLNLSDNKDLKQGQLNTMIQNNSKPYVFDEGKVIIEENNETTSILKTNKQFHSNEDHENNMKIPNNISKIEGQDNNALDGKA